MLKILEHPEDFTLPNIKTKRKITLSKQKGKYLLLSFINIDHSMEWLEHLVLLRNNYDINFISDRLKIIVLLFSYCNKPDRDNTFEKIYNKIPSLENCDITILLDNEWQSSVASKYLQGFRTNQDPLYTGKPDRNLFHYIISSTYQITDKWNINSTRNNNPISFNQIKIKSYKNFESSDLITTVPYIIERIFKLIDEPEVLTVEPEPCTLLKELTRITIVYSKPMIESDITYKKNYTIEGKGTNNLYIDSIQPEENNPYSSIFINIKGELNTRTGGPIQVILNRSKLRDFNGHPLVGKSTITYTADTKEPTVTAIPKNNSSTFSVTDIILLFSKTVRLDQASVRFRTDEGPITNVQYHIKELSENKYLLNSNVESLLEKKHHRQIEIELEGISDKAGNKLSKNVLKYRYDVSFPKILFTEIVPDPQISYVAPLEEISIPFDQDVLNADKYDSYTCMLNNEMFRDFEVSYENKVATIKLHQTLQGQALFSIYLYNITNKSGNQLRDHKKIDITIDTKTVAIDYEHIEPDPEKPINEVRYITIPFNKHVVGADLKKNYTITYNGQLLDFYTVFYKEQYASILFNEPYRPERSQSQLAVSINNICDRYENLIVGKSSFTIYIDTVPPLVLENNIVPVQDDPVNSIKTIEIPFSKEMKNASRKNNFNITFNGKTDDTFKLSYKDKKTTISWEKSVISEETILCIKIVLNNLLDIAGNELEGKREFSFNIDSTRPHVLNEKITPDITLPVHAINTIVIPYSKDVVNGDDTDNFSLLLNKEPFTEFDLAYRKQATVITLHETLSPPEKTSTFSIKMFNAIQDRAGNIIDGTCDFQYTIDTEKPWITAISPEPNDKTGLIKDRRISTLKQITVSFSKPVQDATSPKNYSLTGSGLGSLTIDKIEKRPYKNEYIIHLKGSPVRGNLTFHCNGIRDIAGNKLEYAEITYRVQKPRDIVILYDSGKPLSQVIPLLECYFSLVHSISALGDKIGFIIQTPKEKLTIQLCDVHDLYDKKDLFARQTSPAHVPFWKLVSSARSMFNINDDGLQNRGSHLVLISLPAKPPLATLIQNKNRRNNYFKDCTVVDDYFDKTIVKIKNTRSNSRIHAVLFGHNLNKNSKVHTLVHESGGLFLWNYTENALFKTTSSLSFITAAIFKDLKLQVLAYNFNKINSDKMSEHIVLNRSIKKVIVTLFWQGAKPLVLRLLKDNTPVTAGTTIYQGTGFYSVALDFPVKQNNRKILPEGTWDIEINRQFKSVNGKISYQLVTLVVDPNINCTFYKFTQPVTVGEEVDHGIGVFEGEKTIKKIYSIEAVTEVPTGYMGNLLSDKKIVSARSKPGQFLKTLHNITGLYGDEFFDRVYTALCSDTMIENHIQKKIRTNNELTRITGSNKQRFKNRFQYMMTFSRTKNPGMYPVIYTIKGLGEKTGTFERVIMTTLFIKQEIAPDKTKISGQYSTKLKKFILEIVLIDHWGNITGPGHSAQISCAIGAVRDATIADNLNGSYTVSVKVPNLVFLKEHNAVIKISGNKVYNDTAIKLRKK